MKKPPEKSCGNHEDRDEDDEENQRVEKGWDSCPQNMTEMHDDLGIAKGGE